MAREVGDPIDAALVKKSVRRRLFGIDEPVMLGRFVVEERLGAGGMGIVFRVRDPELGRTVAVKLLHPTGDEETLLDEARALASLRHPHVVAVHDIGTWQDRVFVLMEHVPGGTLREWLAAAPRSWREVLAVLLQAARGIAAAHQAGLVHRDIKPENVLVADGQARVVDFGLARPQGGALSGQAAGTVTLPGGTPAYAAPECLAGGRANAASDQYSFAVMLHEALHGGRPHAGGTLRGGVPGRLTRIAARALSADPAARFPSMDALIAELERDPGRRLRIAAVAAVLTLGGAGAALALVPEVDPCPPGASRLGEVWNAERRAALERTFAASKAPYAEDVRRSVVAALDAYAAGWEGSRLDACRATHVRHEQSPAVQDLRMRCLDRARAGLVATLAHLVEARSVDGALASVEALPLVSACGDLEALRAPVPPPDDPVARVRLTELEARLAEVFARTAAADLDAAQDLAATLVEDAERLGYRPFLAEALLAKGLAEAQAGEPRAFATLDEALLQAQAGGHDAVLARAAIALLTFAETRDDEDRYGWARLAGATIEKLGTPPALAASHRGALGSFHMKAGRFPEGLPLLREALAFSERAGQAGTLGHSVILNDLGNALGVAGAGEASMARLEEALALRLRLLGEDHPNVAATLINIGVEHNMRGRPEKALVPLERARAIALGLDDRFRHLLAKVDAARAASFSQLGRHDESIAARRAALALEEKLYPDDAERLADAHLRLGSALRSGGRADEAQPALDRALELISRGRPEDHPDRVRYLIARGDNLIVLRRAEEAIRECERAAAIVTRVYGPTRLTLVYAWTCLGEGALALGRREEARERFERAAALAKVLGADPRVLKELERLLQEAR